MVFLKKNESCLKGNSHLAKIGGVKTFNTDTWKNPQIGLLGGRKSKKITTQN